MRERATSRRIDHIHLTDANSFDFWPWLRPRCSLCVTNSDANPPRADLTKSPNQNKIKLSVQYLHPYSLHTNCASRTHSALKIRAHSALKIRNHSALKTRNHSALKTRTHLTLKSRARPMHKRQANTQKPISRRKQKQQYIFICFSWKKRFYLQHQRKEKDVIIELAQQCKWDTEGVTKHK